VYHVPGARAQAATYEANSAANAGDIHNASYSYQNDGTLNTLDNAMDAKFDQTSTYDFAGRLRVNDVGNSTDGYSYKQTLSYDAFNNLTSRWSQTYSLTANSFSAGYTNNRKISGGATVTYDAAGNMLTSNQGAPVDSLDWEYDASGRQSRWEEFGPYGANVQRGEETTVDGDGRAAKKVTLTKYKNVGVWGDWLTYNAYFIYSSATGQKITTLLSTGALEKNHVYFGSNQIAEESGGVDFLRVTDPISGSSRDVDPDGAIFPGDEESTRNEAGAMGMSIPHSEPSTMPEPTYSRGGNLGNSEAGCQLNGAPVNCDEMRPILKSLGFFRGTNHLIKQTWKEKRFYTYVGEAVEQSLTDYVKENGVYRDSVWELTSTEIINLPFIGTKESLDEGSQRKYDSERAKLKKRLDGKLSNECLNLLSKVGGLDKVIEAVNLQRAYNGSTSTISRSDAGMLNEEALKTSTISPGAIEFERNQKVSEYFAAKRINKATTAIYPGGRPPSLTSVSDRSDVYFRPGASGILGKMFGGEPSGLEQSTILHEAIHSLTGLEDPELYNKLTGKTATGDAASAGITDALVKAGCVR